VRKIEKRGFMSVGSGEFLVDGRVLRPAEFDKFGRRTSKASLEALR